MQFKTRGTTRARISFKNTDYADSCLQATTAGSEDVLYLLENHCLDLDHLDTGAIRGHGQWEETIWTRADGSKQYPCNQDCNGTNSLRRGALSPDFEISTLRMHCRLCRNFRS